MDKFEDRPTRKSKKRSNKGFPYKNKRGTRISYDKILIKSSTKGNSKVECENCSKIKRIKFMVKYKGKILCSACKPNKL